MKLAIPADSFMEYTRMKKGSFFKITSLSMFALLTVFSYQSAVAQVYTDEATVSEELEVAEAESEEAEAPICYDENNEEVPCDVETETEALADEEAVAEEAPVCYNEDNEAVPCE